MHLCLVCIPAAVYHKILLGVFFIKFASDCVIIGCSRNLYFIYENVAFVFFRTRAPVYLWTFPVM
ncbi:MAG: hypothetical protein A3E60_01185 [Candidatus Kerfeldbacteria bacterium RIFCSPHIGHO2_12_FULL_42_13]|nr:MAG: hypothetical protein A3E60_01185 [Candidatus Kerfeldbacteria bacterium RIFCSPHIGHO2_12_FULL_42_13]